MERLMCVMLGFAAILTGFWSNLYKADTGLWRTHWVGPVDVHCTQVSPVFFLETYFIEYLKYLQYLQTKRVWDFPFSIPFRFYYSLYFCSIKCMDTLTLKRHNSFQNENNRKATHSFAPRPLIFNL